MSKLLSCAVVAVLFPAGTTEEQFVFTVKGANANESFAATFTSSSNSYTASATDLPPGDYTYTVTKNGNTSLPSDVFTVTASAPSGITFSVPDAAQKASTPADVA